MVLSSIFLFAVTAAGVVPCGGPKMSTRAASKVQIILSFWFYEISEVSLRNHEIIIGLDSFNIVGPIMIIIL